jgi:hypothetical protein
VHSEIHQFLIKAQCSFFAVCPDVFYADTFKIQGAQLAAVFLIRMFLCW